ncbi:hypothetical protein [Namhaeicola litoreus]|uniref:Uncharacterized protein n=1 Tax=Namhaeicola litoreus TaxID=1052145 RepID=A0ABW3Y0N8_9FLAO
MSNQDKDTNIILSISTALINGSNVDQCVIFSDDRGDGSSSSGNSKNYISKVNKGKKVNWTASVNPNSGQSNPGDTVTVVAVLKKPDNLGGDDILEKDCYYQNGNLVEGKVKSNAELDATENYLVVFAVTTASTAQTTSYIIDPRIKIVTQN